MNVLPHSLAPTHSHLPRMPVECKLSHTVLKDGIEVSSEPLFNQLHLPRAHPAHIPHLRNVCSSVSLPFPVFAMPSHLYQTNSYSSIKAQGNWLHILAAHTP